MHTNLDFLYINDTIEWNPPLELELMLIASFYQFFVDCRVAIKTAIYNYFGLASFSATMSLNSLILY